MTHVELHRIGHTGLFVHDEGNTARIPCKRHVLPRPLHDIISVDVRIRPQDVGPLYTQGISGHEVADVYLRPGLIVDYYA